MSPIEYSMSHMLHSRHGFVMRCTVCLCCYTVYCLFYLVMCHMLCVRCHPDCNQIVCHISWSVLCNSIVLQMQVWSEVISCMWMYLYMFPFVKLQTSDIYNIYVFCIYFWFKCQLSGSVTREITHSIWHQV